MWDTPRVCAEFCLYSVLYTFKLSVPIVSDLKGQIKKVVILLIQVTKKKAYLLLQTWKQRTEYRKERIKIKSAYNLCAIFSCLTKFEIKETIYICKQNNHFKDSFSSEEQNVRVTCNKSHNNTNSIEFPIV